MKKRIIQIMFWCMLIVYIILMLLLLFITRIGIDFRGINLIPFNSIVQGIGAYDYLIRFAFTQMLGNVLIFIPAGVYLMVLSRKDKIFGVLFITFFISLAVEVIQYTFKLGISDINDIILNCLGGLIGAFIFYLLKKIVKTKEKAITIITILSFCIGAPIIVNELLIFLNLR